MNTRTSPWNKALKEVRTVLVPAFLVAIGFNLFASNSIPWLGKVPETEAVSDEDLFGDAQDTAVIMDALDAVLTDDTTTSDIDTALVDSEEEMKRKADSIKAAQKRMDSLAQAKKDSITKAREASEKAAATPEIETAQGEAKGITTAQAKKVFDRKAGLFIDARRSDQFAKGHIPNAINIYASEFSENIPKVISIPKDKLIVVYCDGGLCDLSHELSAELMQFGFTKVVIYTGGWEEWSKTDYPKTSGE